MSLSEIARFVLIPGRLETLQDAANQGHNLAYYSLAKGMIQARNILFFTVAMGAMATIGASYTCNGDHKITCYTSMTLGASALTIAALVATSLFHDAQILKNIAQRHLQQLTDARSRQVALNSR